MPVRLENGTLEVEGACTIEEAEALHAELRGLDGVAIDLTAAGHLHTAIVQLLMSLSGPVRGIGEDPLLQACFSGRVAS